MNKLTISQLLAIAAAAGFSGDDLVNAVAIALAESGGNPQAYNPEVGAGAPQGYGSFGLWQIYLKAHPEFQGQNLFDPQSNASAAFSVYSNAGGSFSPWSTFKNGAYGAYLDAVNQVIQAPSSDVVASGDGTDGGTGSGPGSGGVLAIVGLGAVIFWGVLKIFNG